MKIFITQYALSKGIQEVEGELLDKGAFPDTVRYTTENNYLCYFYKEGVNWHRTIESARAKANLMVAEKIKSLKKQLALLEKKKF